MNKVELFKEFEKTMSIDKLLLKASSYGLIEYIDKYLDMGADVNGNIDYEKAKQNNNYDPYKYSPLYNSLGSNHIYASEYLVKRGADVNLPKGLIIEIVCIDGDEHFSKTDNGEPDAELEMLGTNFLLKHGANINVLNYYGETIIESVIISVTAVWDLVIDFLLENGADINLKNSKGETPLDIIIKEPHKERAVDFLIKRGAKLSSDL